MRCAFLLFDNLTALDFVGVYDPLTRLRSMQILSSFSWELCARTERITDDRGLEFRAGQIGGALNQFDLLVVPGGFGTRQLVGDSAFLEWLQSAAEVPFKASVCTGALLLGAAGFLKGKSATTHASARHELEQYGVQVRTDRVVDAGDVVTCGGVTAGIDLGLYLVERLAGVEARNRIMKQMEYTAAP